MVFEDPATWRSAADLRDSLQASPATLHDELQRLSGAGLVERDDAQRPHRYRPDMSSPLAEPLKALVDRSVGISARLRRVLAAEPGVQAAAIFGSWARGEAGAHSDIDLLVVGDVDFTRIARAVRPLEREIRREINIVAYAPRELHQRKASSFLRRVGEQPVENFVGDMKAELRSIA